MNDGEILRALTKHTPVGIFVSDVDGSCVLVNDRWCELAGLSREQALGDGWTCALHPDDRDRVTAEWLAAARDERDSTAEYRFRRPDGSVIWVQGFASARRDGSGRVNGWAGTVVDMTVRKAAEEAAAEANGLFRAAFENAPIGIALTLTSPEDRWLRVNKAFCDLVGYTEEQLLDLTISDLTHPDDRAASRARRARLLGGDTDVRRIEKRYVRADGSIVWVEVTSTPVRDQDGVPIYTVAHIEDITVRRRAQKALVEAEERFRRAFDDAPIGMGLVAPDGRFLRVNPLLCEITGYDEAELLQRSFQDITHPHDLEADLDQAQSLLDGATRSYSMEKRYVRPDRSVVWVMLSVSLVRDAEGVPLYFVAQVQEIGDRKRAEAESARLLALEREHVERLRTLDRLKDELVASVSHELRTPMTSIQGYLDLLLEGAAGELNDEQRRHLLTVRRNSERLIRVVGDLLFVAQANAGRLDLSLAEVDLGALVLECAESARVPAETKGVRLDVSVEPVPTLHGDRVRLGQLLDNLVSNAIKFTPVGGRVTVALTQRDREAVLEVSDTGMGIAAAEQEHLFERFFRTKSATKSAVQGTGLGLSIARTIAEGHGGTIGFESAEGDGTTFRVTLPLRIVWPTLVGVAS
jgi:two-component system, sensor histidine kinase and response regulator